MAYYLDLFSPETYEAFTASDRSVSGFRVRQANVAKRVQPGDKLVCYLTRLSRWVGILKVLDGPFNDGSPIFFPENDPFVIRFHVAPVAWLPVEQAVPIHEDEIWNSLSFTKDHQKASTTWTGKLRGSLVGISDADGRLIESAILSQVRQATVYPIDAGEYRKATSHRVRRADKDVSVTVPEDADQSPAPASSPSEVRESIRVQALLAQIGGRMGMDIWLPRSDRVAVTKELQGNHAKLLERLPLNYDDTTLRTIEQIDVLWLKGRSIRRAFEVEHTTSVYSGILRMADLLALQPNMDIRLHIVAPTSRRDKVFQEIRRPVFSLLDRGPLSESCTYLSYESIRELAEQPHLEHLSDSVLDEYEEDAD